MNNGETYGYYRQEEEEKEEMMLSTLWPILTGIFWWVLTKKHLIDFGLLLGFMSSMYLFWIIYKPEPLDKMNRNQYINGVVIMRRTKHEIKVMIGLILAGASLVLSLLANQF